MSSTSLRLCRLGIGRFARIPRLAFALSVLPVLAVAAPRVVINEIMYHPPEDHDELQWIELFNPGNEPVDLSGWSLKKGVRFQFSNGAVLKGQGYLVLARDRAAFARHYGDRIPVHGEFKGRLKHGGEAIDLEDRDGNPVDAVEYDDREPWPLSPDGMSASLERITATGPGNDPWNWAPSPVPPFEHAAGTPGEPNTAARANAGPVISDLQFTTPRPGEPMRIDLQVVDPDGVRDVRLEFHARPLIPPFNPNQAPAWHSIAMQRISGTAGRATYHALIPGQRDGTLIRFRVHAVDGTGSQRTCPHPEDARPSWSAYVGLNQNTAQIPFAMVWEFGREESSAQRRNSGRFQNSGSQEPSRGNAALVFIPPKGGAIQLFDHIRVTPRKAGWKVRLHKDRLLDQMSTINVLFEAHPRQVLAEHLAYEVYREAGIPTPQSGYWRLWRNGRPYGYHLFVEQPNSSFLRRNGRDDDGDLFKILWYGEGVIGQHEKKNNPESGHTQIIEVINALERTRGDAQWQLIQQQFNVPEVASYFAVNMCIQNWDGFFNNHFVYRSPGRDGKWEIFPWDEDKTWGDHDGASPNYDWYTMPLTTGMNGDRPSRSIFGVFAGGPFGGTAWWRPPGWFSGPLLANPQFRAVFRQRLEELCETVFTPDRMVVPITRVERWLEPEVRFRAQALRGGRSDAVEAAVREFKAHIESFHRQVTHRREFILKELAKEG